MEFRRINDLPPYVFATINELKLQARREGKDVIDMGFGNPDLPSPQVAVDKFVEAAQNPRNHKYSSSRGIPKLRQAAADLYLRRFGVSIDPETEVIATMGAKEGLSHLMWVMLGEGDTAMVPTPSYPIHIYAPLFAGAGVLHVHVEDPSLVNGDVRAVGDAFMAETRRVYDAATTKPRVLIASFPHNPTTACVDLACMQELVDFARERDIIIVHDFAYADGGYDGYEPPSILQAEGAKDVAVELYTLTKSFSMAGWRSAFMVGNAEIVGALTKLKSYLDYGTFQPIQIASIVAMNEASDYPFEVREIYQGRRNALVEGLSRIGWDFATPRGTMFVWAPIPEPYREMGALEFSKFLVTEAEVASSPGNGFGPGGEDHVRFALIENEQRIAQAVRNLRKVLTKLG